MEPVGGQLTIELREVDPKQENDAIEFPDIKTPHVMLRVTDTGCGMSPEIMSIIFDPYFTTKELGEGTGLGLSVVHGIVKECGGEILVESEISKGTTFTLLLPLAQLENVIEPGTSKGEEQVIGGDEHILLVDDELPILQMFSRTLKSNGYMVTTESNSLAVIDKISQYPETYDLVISDVTMPGLTGDRLAIEIHKICPDMPVVLMTGYSHLANEDMLETAKARALFIKPMARATLLKRIRTILDEESTKKRR
jgi:CheY-like chemotaxis protein